jgi:hypothetical protein
MSKSKSPRPRFKVGDWVSFPYGARTPVALIIEDRGPIGVKGRRLYRIELPIEDCEPDRFEVAEEYMIPATPPEKPAKVS